MPSLRELQTRFSDAVLAADGMAPAFARGDAATAAERMAIYRRTIRSNYRNALAAPGANVLLNAPYGPEAVWNRLPREMQETILAKRLSLFVIDGGTTKDENANLVGVAFHTADLAKLTPGKVRVNLTGETVSLHTFAAYKCH